MTGVLTNRRSDGVQVVPPPDRDSCFVMEDYEQRDSTQRWLLQWAPDSGVYARGKVTIEDRPDAWHVTFRSDYDGSEQAIDVPRRGTPPPPGH